MLTILAGRTALEPRPNGRPQQSNERTHSTSLKLPALRLVRILISRNGLLLMDSSPQDVRHGKRADNPANRAERVSAPDARPVEIPDHELDLALARAARRNLIILSGLIGLAHVAFVLRCLFFPSGSHVPFLIGKNVAIVLLAFVIGFVLKGRRFHMRLVHPAGAGVAGMILASCLLNLYLRAELSQTIYVMLLLVVAGFAFLSARWYALVMSITLTIWAGALWVTGSPDRAAYLFGLFTAATLSAVVQRTRFPLARRAEMRRLQNLRRTAQLEAALLATEEARRELADALREVQASEQRYRTLIESTENVVYTHDLAGHLLSVNPTAVRLLGCPREELLGASLGGFLVPRERRMFEDHLAQLDRKGEDRGLMWVLTKSGEERVWFYHSLIYEEADKPPYVLGNAQDITERIRVEEKLRETQAALEARVRLRTAELTQINETLKSEITARELAEEALREAVQFTEEIISNAGEGILVYDREMRCRVWNRSMEGLTRRPAGEVLGRLAYDIFPHLREQGIDDLHRRALNGETVSSPDTPVVTAFGEVVWISGTYAPHRNSKGEIIGIIALIRDVTVRKRAQQELEEFTARLERSNYELQHFASIASHDLQEPLRKVRAFSDRLQMKYSRALGPDGQDYIERMQNATHRMQTLIDDLLAFSRVTTRAQPFIPVDLSQVTREVLTDLEVRVEQSGGRIEVGDLPVVEADPLQMRQLLQNLIGNALKFHRPKVPPVVTLSAELLPAPQAPREQICRLLVADNGIGFDEKYLDRIFAIFQRLHGRSEYEGTGVGLAICRKIVERHGGTITARSLPKQGAIFIITLPVRQTEAPGADEETGAAARRAAGQ